MKKQCHVFVSGKVQGVAFRYYARQTAVGMDLSGWIKNLDDGRVELLLEGEADSVAAMIDWCRKGPPAALVTKVEADEGIYRGNLSDFRIAY